MRALVVSMYGPGVQVTCLHVSPVPLHIEVMYVPWCFLVGIAVSTLDTHIFPAQARFAILA